MSQKLDKKEILFCREFVSCLNATKAYMRVFQDSSYEAAKVSACHKMKKPEIAEYISELMEERSQKIELTAEQVIYDLIEIKNRCMQAEPVKEFCHEEKRMIETGEFQFKESGALKALELMGKHLAMWTDKKEVEVKVGEGIAERIAEAKERIKKAATEANNKESEEDEQE